MKFQDLGSPGGHAAPWANLARGVIMINWISLSLLHYVSGGTMNDTQLVARGLGSRDLISANDFVWTTALFFKLRASLSQTFQPHLDHGVIPPQQM